MVLLIIIPTKNGYFIGNIPHFQTNPYPQIFAYMFIYMFIYIFGCLKNLIPVFLMSLCFKHGTKTWLCSNQAAGSPSTARHCMRQLPTPSWCDWGWSPADHLQRSVDPGNRFVGETSGCFLEFFVPEIGVENHRFWILFWSCLFPKFCKIMGKLWHDWIFLEKMELKVMSQMDTNEWICNKLHLRMDSFNKNFDWGWSWTSECYWSSLAIQEKKNSDQDLNSPCLTRKTAQVLGRAGLGPRPIKSDTKTWYIRIYGILTGAKYMRNHGGLAWLGPNIWDIPTTESHESCHLPKPLKVVGARPCQLPPWTACKRPSHLGQRDPGDLFIGTPSSFSKKCHVSWEKLTKIRKQPWVWVPQF